MQFEQAFSLLTGYQPMRWQRCLFKCYFCKGEIPYSLDLPTGLGKTSVMAIWLIARALTQEAVAMLPRRLVYIVDRRAVVDQATAVAEKLREALMKPGGRDLARALGFDEQTSLPISPLRGQHIDNRDWLADPAATAIIVGTVDMIGSRLLFEGYGVSPRMRPYHAGLLGADTLIVLDEAHLVPPFQHLLRAVETDATLRAREERTKIVPPLVVLPLSATQREEASRQDDRKPFRLPAVEDELTATRLNAQKRLHFSQIASGRSADEQLAETAFNLAASEPPARVVVFCSRRDTSDEGATPTAEGVKAAIEKRAGAHKEAVNIELLVGARRAYERQEALKKLKEVGFVEGKGPPLKPTFLIATAAGEVGVDLDADHMVCDLAPFERMVQRLGRVNRRGLNTGGAKIVVFWSEPETEKSQADAAADPEKKRKEGQGNAEKRTSPAIAAKAVLEKLPEVSDGPTDYNASPRALAALMTCTCKESALAKLISQATTPEPLRPALNRPLVEAWSMTSLKQHTGRPEVAPWLRGWIDNDPSQTTVVWRKHLPIRNDWKDSEYSLKADDLAHVAAFFEAAPPHVSEKLETETFRVIEWLRNRIEALQSQVASAPRPVDEASADDDASQDALAEADDNNAQNLATEEAEERLHAGAIIAFVISASGDAEGEVRLDSALSRDKKKRERLQGLLAGKTLIVDARLGGLSAGMLRGDAAEPATCADADNTWSEQVGFRVRRIKAGVEDERNSDRHWRPAISFELKPPADEDGLPARLQVEQFSGEANDEDARSVSKPQTLEEHQCWAENKAKALARRLGLPADLERALRLAARLHDEGKKADRWQRAFNARRHACEFGGVPLAKTRGPINQQILGQYRHEFGSLGYVSKDANFLDLPAEMQDLVLHLVAAHHGRARPVIETEGCEDLPPSALRERAAEVALRFARLQKQWGPWGLAWLEALLRAADAQASRENDERDGSAEVARGARA
ncbi:MAG: type I-U CRISPR-associated helicase/endonuclease Cas3 [Parvularculaceae bacterium]|nr:type I-U CRISPR-associated helicase/endonuclease Cas3 [Parvularculaceae bacterium]